MCGVLLAGLTILKANNMEQYIKKSALVAEITHKIKVLEAFIKNFDGISDKVEKAKNKIEALSDELLFLDTLEVKEVDLEKELDSMITPELKFHKALPSLFDVAKHFFELGLKAQHDNWKVVDNTNLPQEDRNKIYCVFTKQRYILAKVINQPQDGELLQWKCTEFPHHSYDMCEGDKYMEIA